MDAQAIDHAPPTKESEGGAPSESVVFEDMLAAHWPAVAAIYEAGIATRNATFESVPPSWEEWDRKHLTAPRLVAIADGRAVGWAALGPVSSACAYDGVGEISVYIDPTVAGRGIGRALLTELIARSEQAGMWTLEAWVFPENEASVRLHRACGFRVVGVREKLGQMDGRWRDVMLMERRSPVF